MSLSSSYARFRSSRLFLLLLCAFLAFWFGCNLLPYSPHFDRPGFGILNVVLSSEASLSVALLMAAAERQDEVQRAQLKYMLHLLEVNRDLLVGDEQSRTDGAPRQGMGARNGES